VDEVKATVEEAFQEAIEVEEVTLPVVAVDNAEARVPAEAAPVYPRIG
jgi:hypothetical protein